MQPLPGLERDPVFELVIEVETGRQVAPLAQVLDEGTVIEVDVQRDRAEAIEQPT